MCWCLRMKGHPEPGSAAVCFITTSSGKKVDPIRLDVFLKTRECTVLEILVLTFCFMLYPSLPHSSRGSLKSLYTAKLKYIAV